MDVPKPGPGALLPVGEAEPGLINYETEPELIQPFSDQEITPEVTPKISRAEKLRQDEAEVMDVEPLAGEEGSDSLPLGVRQVGAVAS